MLLLLATTARSDILTEVAGHLIGKFTTEWQAKTKANEADMRTETIRLWPAETDGIWLYTEVKHAADSYAFRQRVIHLVREENLVVMREFVPHNATKLNKDELNPIVWCDMHITRVSDKVFKGAVRSGGCRDDHRGAAFVTQEIQLNKWVIVRSRFGYTGKGKLVWSSKIPEEHVRLEK